MKKINSKRMLSIVLAAIMLVSMFAAMAAPAAAGDIEMNTIKIYGDEDPDNEIYPTIYNGGYETSYVNAIDPFDPTIVRKDSITFNPAIVRDMAFKASGKDAGVKIYQRDWYETDHIYDGHRTVVKNEASAIVLEHTYFLIDYTTYEPIAGTAGDSRFMLPTMSEQDGGSRDPDNSVYSQPGMEVSEVVDLREATVDPTGGSIVKGQIEVEKQVTLKLGESAKFMDHALKFENNYNPNDKVDVGVWYLGNVLDDDGMPNHDRKKSITLDKDVQTYVDRANVVRLEEHQPSADDESPSTWYVEYLRSYTQGDVVYADFLIGKSLEAGDVFYVDGVRYEVAAVYVEYVETLGRGAFKYITLRTPLPKLDQSVIDLYDDEPTANNLGAVRDVSVVSSQWLEEVYPYETMWKLPPFNEEHSIVDDIDIPEDDSVAISDSYDQVEERVIGPYGPIDYYYIDETVEPRYSTNLLERPMDYEGGEYWAWWQIRTKPDQYTEFVLPTDPINDVGDDLLRDYLVTTSFRSDNIRYGSPAVELGGTVKDHYAHFPDQVDDPARVAFVYQAEVGTDLYVNELASGTPTVRIYGDYATIQHGYDPLYPTVYDADRGLYYQTSYVNSIDPFDPTVIPKDSITFNPAIMDEYNAITEFNSGLFEYSSQNAREKVYERTWYEPVHVYDGAEPETENVADAIVTEHTYFLIDYSTYDPAAGKAGETYLMLPTVSLEEGGLDGQPGMDEGEVVRVAAVAPGATSVDGIVGVEIDISLAEGGSRQFMDHEITYVGPTDEDNPDANAVCTVKYKGNVLDNHAYPSSTFELDANKTYVDRNNYLYGTPDFPTRTWYMKFNGLNGNNAEFTIGKLLKAGDVFYVDGVRYEVAAVHTEISGQDILFKYITLRTPIPKAGTSAIIDNEPGDGARDIKVVTSQWLEELDPNEAVWKLPPYNKNHDIVDDIDVPQSTTRISDAYDEVIERVLTGYGPLEYYYVDETIEERFHTNLLERLFPYGPGIGVADEIWTWWHIRSMPDKYTEFVLPADTINTGDLQNDYLITLSYEAPNCRKGQEFGTEELDGYKMDTDTHDLGPNEWPRASFVFDGINSEGLFIEQTDLTGDAIVSGTVEEVNGDALSGATVEVVTLTDTTAGDGSYSIGTVPLGKDLEITASKAAFNSEIQYRTIRGDKIVDFVGENGLIPITPTTPYLMQCIGLWQSGELSTGKILDVIDAWM